MDKLIVKTIGLKIRTRLKDGETLPTYSDSTAWKLRADQEKEFLLNPPGNFPGNFPDSFLFRQLPADHAYYFKQYVQSQKYKLSTFRVDVENFRYRHEPLPALCGVAIPNEIDWNFTKEQVAYLSKLINFLHNNFEVNDDSNQIDFDAFNPIFGFNVSKIVTPTGMGIFSFDRVK